MVDMSVEVAQRYHPREAIDLGNGHTYVQRESFSVWVTCPGISEAMEPLYDGDVCMFTEELWNAASYMSGVMARIASQLSSDLYFSKIHQDNEDFVESLGVMGDMCCNVPTEAEFERSDLTPQVHLCLGIEHGPPEKWLAIVEARVAQMLYVPSFQMELKKTAS